MKDFDTSSKDCGESFNTYNIKSGLQKYTNFNEWAAYLLSLFLF